MKTYDALYIFVGISKDDVLEANLEKALAEITRLGGNVIAKDSLGKRAFARSMKKRDSGVYVKVRFEIDPLKIKELVKRCSAFSSSPSTSVAKRRSLPSVQRVRKIRPRETPLRLLLLRRGLLRSNRLWRRLTRLF